MPKHFYTHNELLDCLFDILHRRADLVVLQHQIRYALKNDVPRWSLEMYYNGVVFPVYKSGGAYTFQIVVTNQNGEDYQNISVDTRYTEHYQSYQGNCFLGNVER